MSDRRTREQHRRKFQELINPENRSKHFRSDTPAVVVVTISLAAAEAKAIISTVAEAKATISLAIEGKKIITLPSTITIPSAAEAKATTMPLLAAEAKAIKIPSSIGEDNPNSESNIIFSRGRGEGDII